MRRQPARTNECAAAKDEKAAVEQQVCSSLEYLLMEDFEGSTMKKESTADELIKNDRKFEQLAEWERSVNRKEATEDKLQEAQAHPSNYR